jgi:hypothetical protein
MHRQRASVATPHPMTEPRCDAAPLAYNPIPLTIKTNTRQLDFPGLRAAVAGLGYASSMQALARQVRELVAMSRDLLRCSYALHDIDYRRDDFRPLSIRAPARRPCSAVPSAFSPNKLPTPPHWAATENSLPLRAPPHDRRIGIHERRVTGDHFDAATGNNWPDRDGRGVRTRGRFVAVIANADASRGAGELCDPVHRLRSCGVNWEESGG